MLVKDSFGVTNNNKELHHSFQNSCSPKLSLHHQKLSLIHLILSEEDWWWKVVRLWKKDNTGEQLIVGLKFWAKKVLLDFSRVTWVTSGEVLVVHWFSFCTTNSKKCLPIMDIDKNCKIWKGTKKENCFYIPSLYQNS